MVSKILNVKRLCYIQEAIYVTTNIIYIQKIAVCSLVKCDHFSKTRMNTPEKNPDL